VWLWQQRMAALPRTYRKVLRHLWEPQAPSCHALQACVLTSLPPSLSACRWAPGGSATGLLNATVCSAGEASTLLYIVTSTAAGTVIDSQGYNDAVSTGACWSGDVVTPVNAVATYYFVATPADPAQASWQAQLSVLLQP